MRYDASLLLQLIISIPYPAAIFHVHPFKKKPFPLRFSVESAMIRVHPAEGSGRSRGFTYPVIQTPSLAAMKVPAQRGPA